MNKTCLICNKKFHVKPSHAPKRNTCSLRCKGIQQSLLYKGKGNPKWRGGRLQEKQGYILIYQPAHPYHDKDGYVREHRLVMEKEIGRYLDPKEVIHHINGIKNDNRKENLRLFSNSSGHTKHEIENGNIPLDYWRGKKLSEEHRKKVIKTLIHGHKK